MRPGSSGDRPHSGQGPRPRLSNRLSVLLLKPTAPLRLPLLAPRSHAAPASSVTAAGSGLGWFAALARASRLASRASLNWFLRRLLISRTFRRSNRGPCALSPGRPSSPTPRNLGYGILYVGALPPCPGSRCRISPWPLRCSLRLRLDVHQLRRLLLVVRYQTLEDGPVTLGLALVALAPRRPVLFSPSRVVASHRPCVAWLENPGSFNLASEDLLEELGEDHEAPRSWRIHPRTVSRNPSRSSRWYEISMSSSTSRGT